MSKDSYKITAIVSTYNSETFLSGCLGDLVGQTLFSDGALEIVVIDSGSEQGEASIVQKFMSKRPHIRYIRTERESLYAAWNRAIAEARGIYITNANTDDRHRPDALEVLSSHLDDRLDIDLVYGDCYLSTKCNELYSENAKSKLYRFSDYFGPASLLYYQFGPQPMWRKSLHDKIGFFDGSFRAAGDYDFNIRFAISGCKALHVPEPLGLYLEHQSAITSRDNTMALENAKISQCYKTLETVETTYSAWGIANRSPEERMKIFIDMGIRALEFYPPWQQGVTVSDVTFAAQCFQKAIDICPSSVGPYNNQALLKYFGGEKQRALELFAKTDSGHWSDFVRHNYEQIVNDTLVPASAFFLASGLDLPHQLDLFGGQRRNPSAISDGSMQETVSIVPNVWNVVPLFCGEGSGGVFDNGVPVASFHEIIQENKIALSDLLQSIRASRSLVVAVWGAGTAGMQILQFLNTWHVDVDFFIDKSTEKWHSVLGGKIIENPEYLLGLKQEGKGIFVFIASMWHEEIAVSLSELGFKHKLEFISLASAGLPKFSLSNN